MIPTYDSQKQNKSFKIGSKFVDTATLPDEFPKCGPF